MGLAEKRKIKELQEVIIPARQKEVEEISGAQIQFDVNWDSFDGDADALNFFDNLAFHRLNMALRMVCIDDMSKEAIQEGLNTVSYQNVKDKADMAISFAGGVLEMRCAYGMRLDGVYQENEIKKVLEDGL